MEIKVREYVRLARNQGINKIIEIEDKRYILDLDIYDIWGDETCVLEEFELKDEIVKHSPNIIDLIEEDDIIEYKSEQGYDNIIEEVWKVENNNVVTIDGTRINIERVVSIVTKEQFNQMKYIVGDE